eukprot:4834461-Pleurochrysis_carterae.AAC.1
MLLNNCRNMRCLLDCVIRGHANGRVAKWPFRMWSHKCRAAFLGSRTGSAMACREQGQGVTHAPEEQPGDCPGQLVFAEHEHISLMLAYLE